MITSAPCYGKKFGHNVIGSVCIQCGIGRDELALQFVARSKKRPAPAKIDPKVAQSTMHSEDHALAGELSRICGEPGKFAMYLGVVRRVGRVKAYVMLSQIKDPKSNIKQPARWFMWKSKGESNAKRPKI